MTTRDASTRSMTDSTISNPTTTTQPTAKIFVTSTGDNDKIFVADLQNELAFTSIPATKEPRHMTYDPLDNKIYWTDSYEKQVYRADVDGGNRETVTDPIGDELRGIAIANTSRILYIVYRLTRKITSVSIGPGSTTPGTESDFETGLNEKPYSLEVDEKQGYLYWTMTNCIKRKRLNGTEAVDTVYQHSGLPRITGLSIDFTRDPRRIFFCDFDKERTFYKDLNTGIDIAHELTSDLTVAGNDNEGKKLRDIRYFNGVLYWAKVDDPSGIAVMTNYEFSNRSYDITETSGNVKPLKLLVINVDP